MQNSKTLFIIGITLVLFIKENVISKELNIPPQYQPSSKTCWVASCKMILDFHKCYNSAQEIWNYGNSGKNGFISPSKMVEIFEHFGKSSCLDAQSGGTLPNNVDEYIAKAIDKSLPFVSIQTNSNGYAHSVDVIGYNKISSIDFEVIFNDPGYGKDVWHLNKFVQDWDGTIGILKGNCCNKKRFNPLSTSSN